MMRPEATAEPHFANFGLEMMYIYVYIYIHLKSGWWFQPISKNISQIENLSQIGMNIKNIFEIII